MPAVHLRAEGATVDPPRQGLWRGGTEAEAAMAGVDVYRPRRVSVLARRWSKSPRAPTRMSAGAPGSGLGFAVLLEAVVQRLQTDPERFRSLPLAVAEVLQRRQDQTPLGVGGAHADR